MPHVEPPAPQDLIDCLRARVRARGVVRAAAELGVSRHTLERTLAGLGIRRGTVMVMRTALDARPLALAQPSEPIA